MNTSEAGFHLHAMILRELEANERFGEVEAGQARLEEAIAICEYLVAVKSEVRQKGR